MLIIIEYLDSFLLIVAILMGGVWLRRLVLPPSNFPRNIPTIPFYVSFVPVFTNWDQEKIYRYFFREKMEKYGACKVYFAARWNILVSKPEYVLQVIGNNETFEKSGNQEKIPYAVISEYLGDNFISAGNKNWSKYRSVAEDSIKFPDTEPLDQNVDNLMRELVTRAETGPVMVNDIFQKFTLANIGDCIIGCNLKDSKDGVSVHERIIFLKKQIFQPLYMNFTFLDRFPIPSRVRARNAVRLFKKFYMEKIKAERTPENDKKLGPRLVAGYEDGIITEKQVQDNAMIAMIAGHENPQILLTTVIYLLAKHQDVQKKLRKELNSEKGDEESDGFLSAVIYESLRLYPPLGQLINRITRQSVTLGKDIHIPEGIYVGNNSMFTQRDRNYWDNSDDFLPERWGTTAEEISSKYRIAKSKCTLTAFHGRKRVCLGQQFALLEVKKAVARIVQQFSISLDPNWVERVTQSGPIWPVNLSVHLTPVD